MIYPRFLKKKDVISLTAPSEGCSNKKEDLNAFENGIKEFKKRDVKIKETPDCRKTHLGRSDSAKTRAKEFEACFKDKQTNAVLCYNGGEFLVEMLSYVNFNVIKENPKWFLGFSDPTGLLFYITTYLDIATLYGNNFIEYQMTPWHVSLENGLNILRGNIQDQESFDMYEEGLKTHRKKTEPFCLDTRVYWKNITGEKKIQLKGRLIGGCLDVLANIVGTRFDVVSSFVEKYKEDGIVWYFDNCDFTNEQVVRVLWQLKEAGWFKYAKGVVFGRSANDVSRYAISFKDSVLASLKSLNLPIIVDADISHKRPTMTLINGAIVNIESQDGKGKIGFELKE